LNWKVRVKKGMESGFESFCIYRGIDYKPYPPPIERTYGVMGMWEDMQDIGHCLSTLEEMPKGTLN